MPIRLVISESILKEGKEDFLKNQYITTGKQVDTSTFNEIDEETFNKIYSADPFNGKYATWLLNLYKYKQLKLEDLYKAEEYLTLFDKVKNKLPNKDLLARNGKEYVYPSLASLYKAIQPFEEYKSNSELKREVKKNESKRIYEDSEFLVIAPLTENAACYYGANTEWCTAANKDNKFNDYNEHGQLYIIIDKQDKRKYQYFEMPDEHKDDIPDQLMDETDSPVTWENIFKDVNQFIKIFPLIYKSSRKLEFDGKPFLMVSGKMIIPPIYEKFTNGHTNNYVVVSTTGKKGLLDGDGNILLKPIYDYIRKTSTAYILEIDKYKGVCNSLGEIFIPVKHGYISDCHNGTFRVADNHITYLYNTKGEKQFEDGYYILVESLFDTYFVSHDGKKYGVIDINGKILIPLKYDDISSNPDIKHYYISQNSKFGIINANNQIIVPLICDEEPYFDSHKNYGVKISGLKGIYNRYGVEIAKPLYEDIFRYDEYYKLITPNREKIILDTVGNQID